MVADKVARWAGERAHEHVEVVRRRFLQVVRLAVDQDGGEVLVEIAQQRQAGCRNHSEKDAPDLRDKGDRAVKAVTAAVTAMANGRAVAEETTAAAQQQH